jgi:glycine/D-amino acid oxidase-like deaminating enzyme
VDWPQLLRARAAEYQVLRTNRSITYLARRGLDVLLRELHAAPEVLVTGSYAAHRIAPVAAPAQLLLYVPDIDTYAERWDLLATGTGANAVLLEAASGSQLERPRDVDGLRHVGYSQLVMDLLSGNGRLPEEGEVVLQWMIDIPGWRLSDLRSLRQ